MALPDGRSPGHGAPIRRGDDPFVSKGAGIEFYGNHDKKAVVYLRPYLPSPEKTTAEYPLYLTTGRVLEQFHTGTMTDRIVELHQATGDAMFELNPVDARKLGVQSGDRIEVRTRYGAVTGQVRLTEASRLGVVFAAFYDAKLLVNRVVADNYDPLSKEPEYKVTSASVRKVSA